MFDTGGESIWPSLRIVQYGWKEFIKSIRWPPLGTLNGKVVEVKGTLPSIWPQSRFAQGCLVRCCRKISLLKYILGQTLFNQGIYRIFGIERTSDTYQLRPVVKIRPMMAINWIGPLDTGGHKHFNCIHGFTRQCISLPIFLVLIFLSKRDSGSYRIGSVSPWSTHLA